MAPVSSSSPPNCKPGFAAKVTGMDRCRVLRLVWRQYSGCKMMLDPTISASETPPCQNYASKRGGKKTTTTKNIKRKNMTALQNICFLHSKVCVIQATHYSLCSEQPYQICPVHTYFSLAADCYLLFLSMYFSGMPS